MAIATFTESGNFDTDICIIGTGAAGMSIALQFLGSSVDVLMVESGLLDRHPEIEDLNEIESVGQRRAPQDVTRCRGFGGTTALWSGRCGLFDPIDFQQRGWVADSGWPVDRSEILSFTHRASRLLGLGPMLYEDEHAGRFHHGRAGFGFRQDVFKPLVFQFSQHGEATAAPVRAFAQAGVESAELIGMLQHAGAPKPRHFGEAYRTVIANSANIRVLLGATVSEIETDDNLRQARGVRLRGLDGQTGSVRARAVILACGGVDNARLLLASRSISQSGIGNEHDTVGRYLSDHPLGPIAHYTGKGSAALRRRLGHRWIDTAAGRHVYNIGLRLAPEVQQRERLLNGAIHLVDLGERRSAVARAGALVRRLRSGDRSIAMARDALSVVVSPRELTAGFFDRYVLRRPSLETPDRVEFGCVVEQVPDRESRVTLSTQLDRFGMPRAKIDWRVSDREFETARRMAHHLEQELARQGIEQPRYAEWLEAGPNAFRSVVHDMAHPMGATRMSSDPRRGVVDTNGQVHGVSGLFVAGGSVFPTSGYMNPTLMIVTMSLRLADHLKTVLAVTPQTPVHTPAHAA